MYSVQYDTLLGIIFVLGNAFPVLPFSGNGMYLFQDSYIEARYTRGRTSTQVYILIRQQCSTNGYTHYSTKNPRL